MKALSAAFLALVSLSALADCESSLREFRVGFPNYESGSGLTSFSLTSENQQMTVVSRDSNLSDPRVRVLYDALNDAGYGAGVINFGVTPSICLDLVSYQLPVGFGGSWGSLDIQYITSLIRTDIR